MPPLVRRRALVVAADPERRALEALFSSGRLDGWEAVAADGLDRARFVVQMELFEAVVLDAGLYPADGADLAWLGGPEQTPVLFLADAPPGAADALRRGAAQWLPRELALADPSLLAAALGAAAEAGELRRRARRAGESLEEYRRQVSRLVGLLWEAAPAEGQGGWFTQRHMLERLHEEVHRCARHGGPLAVVLGELETPHDTPPPADWAPARVARAKRRCDVAGQYGPVGFMLLLPLTGERGAAACCRRLRAALEAAPDAGATLRASLGFAVFAPGASAASLLCRAEQELERARAEGGVA